MIDNMAAMKALLIDVNEPYNRVVEGIRTASWNTVDVFRKFSTTLLPLYDIHDPVHGIRHIMECVSLLLNDITVLDTTDYDEALMVAVILSHDVGRFVGNDEKNHAEASAIWIERHKHLFFDAGFGFDDIESIISAVGSHSMNSNTNPKYKSDSIYNKLIYDIDKLSRLGLSHLCETWILHEILIHPNELVDTLVINIINKFKARWHYVATDSFVVKNCHCSDELLYNIATVQPDMSEEVLREELIRQYYKIHNKVSLLNRGWA